MHQCPVPDAPYGDVLRRMQRLAWPPTMSAAEKRQMYSVLGGNHRAIEWAAQVLKQEHQQTAELVAALSALHAPPRRPRRGAGGGRGDAPELAVCTAAVLLTSTQDRLLRASSLYRVPVNEDGLLALTDQPAQSAEDWQRLANLFSAGTGTRSRAGPGLLACATSRARAIARARLQPIGAAGVASSHGRYHRLQGQYVSRRWSDDVEAIYHFRQAGNTLPPMRWPRRSAISTTASAITPMPEV